MLDLILIRHGETDWNKEGRCQGFSDIPLNNEGVRQAEALALSLRGRGLKAVYSSPLKRAYDTALRIARYHELDVVTEDGLKELNQGLIEGLTQEEISRKFAGLLESWRSDAGSVAMPEGESLEDLRRRAWSSVERIIGENPNGEVAVVGHNLTNLVIICNAFGVRLSDFRKFRQDMNAVSIIRCVDGKFSLQLLNDTCHLKA